ncbi:hypothetical protein Tco_0448589 [Tanacetum coccineum]
MSVQTNVPRWSIKNGLSRRGKDHTRHKIIFSMITIMGIHNAKHYTLRGGRGYSRLGNSTSIRRTLRSHRSLIVPIFALSVNIFYNGLGALNSQLLDLQGPYPGMTLVQALTAIQTMVDHSQKSHDGSSSRNIESSSNSEGIAAIVNKLENLGQEMKKLKENVHAIQVGCQICKGSHLDKDCPLKEEPSSGEKRLILSEMINKYMEEASKRHDE